HFTTRSDSIFLFSASEFASTRAHAFYVYAVDNQGKADPTPARIIFNVLDNYPPVPVVEELRATGTLFELGLDGQVHTRSFVRLVTDSLTRRNASLAPKDTVPQNARLDIRWHGEPVVAGTFVAGYQYKLDEPDFVRVDSSVHVV